MDKVIPRSIHYADLKPEVIENQIKLVRFTPQTNIQNSVPNDVIRFLLQGHNGFFDPYSAYLHIRFSFKRPEVEEYAIEPNQGETPFVQMKSSYDARNMQHSTRYFNSMWDRKQPMVNVDIAGDNETTLRTGVHSCDFEGGCLSIDDVSTNLHMCSDYKNTQPRPGCEFKMLDRSAHSLISRFVVRSQGTEIERIEQYDAMAAMINDLIYSNEQAQLHSFEGFAGSTLEHFLPQQQVAQLRRDTLGNSCRGPRGRVGEIMFGWAFVGIDDLIQSKAQIHNSKFQLTYDITSDGRLDVEDLQLPVYTYALNGFTPNLGQYTVSSMYHHNYGFRATGNPTFGTPDGYVQIPPYASADGDSNAIDELCKQLPLHLIKQFELDGYGNAVTYDQYQKPTFVLHSSRQGIDEKLQAAWSVNANTPQKRLNQSYVFTQLSDAMTSATSSHSLKNFRPGSYHYVQIGSENFEFVIPIYSGSIGVMMPDKKLLPLAMYPLEVDFTLNQHAVICAASNTFGHRLRRNYQIKQMDLYAHIVTFEQEVFRSLESIIAEHGLFMHMKSFYLSPITVHPEDTVNTTIPINLHFKSINSVHLLFLYQNYQNDKYSRKLHFVSHNLTSLQVRNGTDMIPNEPIQIDQTSGNLLSGRNTDSTIGTGRTCRAFIEMMKAWNKMHDPTTDAALDNGLVYSIDKYATTRTSLAQDFDGLYPANDYSTTVNDASVAYAVQFETGENITDMNMLDLQEKQRYQFYLQNSLRLEIQLINLPITFNPGTDNEATVFKYNRPQQATGANQPFPAGKNAANYMWENARYVPTPDRVGYHNYQYKDLQDYYRHQYLGQFGPNGNRVPLRPAIFFASLEQPIQITQGGMNRDNSQRGYVHGLSARSLNDRIQNFSALTGRCQYAISLEGINLGADNTVLSGKKGMTPFDVMVTARSKSDKKSSISLVFCRYDAVVFIRPDLVVTVLGK